MSIRRTRKDKELAKARWTLGTGQDLSIKYEGARFDKQSQVSEIELSPGSVKADLTRTLVVTILALFLQGLLYMHLQNGGWEKMLAVLSKISI